MVGVFERQAREREKLFIIYASYGDGIQLDGIKSFFIRCPYALPYPVELIVSGDR